MGESKTAEASFEAAMTAAVITKEAADPEVTSVNQLLKLLDKAAKSNRTYGPNNPVAQKFFQQFYEDLTIHLATYPTLGFVVQRSELYCKDVVVYQTESGGDNLAFKLYADGIRELTFHGGLTQEDLTFFLDALWGSVEQTETDDDIVTRLWEKNLATITVVTAEEIAKASGVGDVLSLQTAGAMNASTTSLREVIARENAHQAKTGGDRQGASRFHSGLVGYEVSEEELAALAKEVRTEAERDSTMFVLDMLTVILASEKSPALLTNLFDVFAGVLESLTRQGDWTVLESVLSLLHETEEVRPDLSDEHKKQLAETFGALGRPERIKLVEAYLNTRSDVNTEGLLTLLLLMKSQAVPALCTLLGNLESPAHQSILCDALFTLAKDSPDSLLRSLTDRRPTFVRNLLSIIVRWNNPHHADTVEKLIRHPDAQVRKDVIRAFGVLRPRGNGARLFTVINDPEESIRLAVLKLLTSGHYVIPFATWSPLVSADEFLDRPPAEKRAIFHAMRQTARDDAVPYWQGLLTEWSWTNRKLREELAVMAADALGKLATPAAAAALEIGQKKGNTAVRQACATALAMAARQQKSKPTSLTHP